eukprot:7582413-Pyramimonas_sp.AAC.1
MARASVLGPIGVYDAVVYILASFSAVYCGKTTLSRKGLPGVCARVAEHVRCLLYPCKPPGDRPRH